MTGSRVEEAVSLFRNGLSCSAAVFSVFHEDSGIDKETACRIASGLGAGLGRTGNVCGAMTGAILVLGQRYGMDEPGNQEAKEKTYALVKRFIAEFSAKHGSTTCPGLLGYDMSDPVQFAKAKEQKVAAQICPDLVRDAVTLLEEIFAEEEKTVR